MPVRKLSFSNFPFSRFRSTGRACRGRLVDSTWVAMALSKSCWPAKLLREPTLTMLMNTSSLIIDTLCLPHLDHGLGPISMILGTVLAGEFVLKPKKVWIAEGGF